QKKAFDVAAEGHRNEALDHHGAKTLAQRLGDRGPAALLPDEAYALARVSLGELPADRDLAGWRRQRAVLHRVGAELEQGETEILHRVRLENQVLTDHADAGAVLAHERRELRADQIADGRAGPVLTHQHVVRAREPVQAAHETAFEVLEAARVLHGLA